MKRLLLIILLLVLVGLGFWVYHYLRERDRSLDELILYGNVDIRQVDISFRVEGRVAEVFFDEGDTIEEGVLMACLDPEPYQDAVQQALAQIETAEPTYHNAEILLERRGALKEIGAVSQEDYDDAFANRNIAKGNLDQAKAALQTAMTNLNDTEVYAPTEGWILTRIREPGSVVKVSDPVFTLSVKSPLWIRAYVNEPNLGLIYPGMRAEVFTDTKGSKVYKGHIGFISPMAEFTPKTVETTELRTDLVYRLRVIVDNVDEGLRQGMPVTVRLQLKERTDE